MDAPFKPDLQPLDHDEEVYRYLGYYPEFHPRLRAFCHLDRRLAEENQQQLIERIKGVPERMTLFWIAMYERQPEEAGLQPMIDLLRQFLDYLRGMSEDPASPLATLAGEPLVPIPAALIEGLSNTDARCCNQPSGLEGLPRLADESLDESFE
jgi:hypothetical protein